MRVLVCGDLCLSGEPEQLILGNSDYDLWAGVAPLLDSDTVVIANLECALTDKGEPKPLKWATLRASPKCASTLKRMQVAIIGNNHVSDFGQVGVQETAKCLKVAGVLSVGYGSDLETALQPIIVDRSGVRLAVVSLCCPTTNGENLATLTSPGAAPLGMELLKKAVMTARPQADALLVYLHWGVEQNHGPVPDQIRLAHHAIDWGADAVVGCHAHVIQSYERYRGRWIFYGLGNFVFGPVNTLQVFPDGTCRRGQQEQALSNRQSLAVQFQVSPNQPENRLRLEAIHFLGFDKDYTPRLISPDDLTVNLASLNRRLARYAAMYQRELESDEEPVFRTLVRNGIMAYFYSYKPISNRDFQFSLRRLVQKLKRALGHRFNVPRG